MKTLLLLLLSTALLSAAEPVVIVTSATSVTVDGAPYGKPADVIANNPQLASAVQTALETWAAEMTAEKAEAEADLNALKGRIDTVLNAMLTEELKTGEGPRTAVLRKLIAESKKSDRQLATERLAAEIAEKQAELAKLNKE